MKTLTSFLTLFALTAELYAQGFELPKPTAEHKILTNEAGIWDYSVKMFEGEKVSDFKAVEKVESINGGLHAKSTYTSNMGIFVFTGHSLMGYNSKTKKYVGTWCDNLTAVPVPQDGTYDKETKTMTVIADVIGQDGVSFKQKQITKYLDKNTKTFTIFIVIKKGDQSFDIKIMEATAKRRTKNAKKADSASAADDK